jgi:4-amino-4-deoxy-L-arabinose transferase-like glycosyltransferase
VAVLVGVVVLVRVVLVLAATAADEHRGDSGDKTSYVEPARALLHDRQFDVAEGSSIPEFVRTPGYPLFLAAVYGVGDESDTAVYVVQAVLSGLTVLLTVGLGRRLLGSWALGFAAAVVVGLDPLQASTQGFVGTEGLATVLVVLAAYTGVRFAHSGLAPPWGVAYGVSLAAATYVRPTTFYFTVVPAVLLGWSALRDPGRRRAVLRGGLALLVPCIVLLGAWNVRNRAEVGSWRFSAIESVNLYWYRAADVVAHRDHLGFEEARLALTSDLSRELEHDAGDGDDRSPAQGSFDASDHTAGQLPPRWAHQQGLYYSRAHSAAVDVLRSSPSLVARQVGEGVYSQLVQSGWVSAFEYLTGSRPAAPIRLVGLLAVWSVEILAVVGAVAAWRRDRSPGPRLAHALSIGLVLYTLAASAGPEAAEGSRFRIPVWPIWCVYAVAGARVALAWWQARRTKTDEFCDRPSSYGVTGHGMQEDGRG